MTVASNRSGGTQGGDAAASPPDVAAAFLAAFRHHPSGVAIITADPGDGPVALTVSSLISVSISPPTIAFSLSDHSASARAVRRAGSVVVHFVRRADLELARLCATSGKDRFGSEVEWARLAGGEPYYPQVDLRFRAVIRGRLEAPGACLVTAELLEVSAHSHETREDEALVYANRGWHRLRPVSGGGRAPILLWPDDSATF